MAWGKNAALRSYRRKTAFSRSRDQCAANWCTNFNYSLGLGFGDGLGTSSAFRGWVRVLGYGFGLWFWSEGQKIEVT